MSWNWVGPVDSADRPCVPAGRRRHGAVADDDARWAAQTQLPWNARTLGLCRSPRGPPQRRHIGRSHGSVVRPLQRQRRGPLRPRDRQGHRHGKATSLARLPALYECANTSARRRAGPRRRRTRWRGRDRPPMAARFPDLHFRMVGVGRGLFVASVQKSILDLLPV